jgi:rhamnulokinase
MEEVFKIISRDELIEITGLQFMPINSLYHLVAMVQRGSADLRIVRTFLMIPDMLNFRLTGRKGVEYSNASIPQLLDCKKMQWAFQIRLMGSENIFHGASYQVRF